MKKEVSLKNIYKPVEKELIKVEEKIEKELYSDEEAVSIINEYVLNTSGKRLRPALVLLSGKAVSNHQSPITNYLISLATAIELIHTATLIHDDVIDEGNLRRAKSTVNAKWGDELSVLFGDYLYSKAFSLLVHIRNQEILTLLSSTTNGMCEGEIVQIAVANNNFTAISEGEYLKIIEKKTGRLISACCQTGSILGGADETEIVALQKYGLNFGMAFQIVDDCLDLIGKENELGKSLGSDVRKRKLTLPLIYLLSRSTNKRNAVDWLYEVCQSKHDLLYESINYAFGKANVYVEKAKERIETLGIIPPIKESLVNLLEYIVIRLQSKLDRKRK
ncbi:MAG: polyprenyl synthetase family protein [bacterium]